FAGMLTYKNAADVRDVAAGVPADRVMVETDCPYLSPVPLRGKRNEPANVVHTATCLAGVLGVSLDELAERTTVDARRLFGRPAGTGQARGSRKRQRGADFPRWRFGLPQSPHGMDGPSERPTLSGFVLPSPGVTSWTAAISSLPVVLPSPSPRPATTSPPPRT